jgi:hypothetical protein
LFEDSAAALKKKKRPARTAFSSIAVLVARYPAGRLHHRSDARGAAAGRGIAE